MRAVRMIKRKIKDTKIRQKKLKNDFVKRKIFDYRFFFLNRLYIIVFIKH